MNVAGAICAALVPGFYLLVWSFFDRERLVKCLLLKIREPRYRSYFYSLPLTPFSAWFCVMSLLLILALWIWA